MQVLVIGGAGMLGRALARMLHQAGHRVTSFDLLPCPESGVTSLSGDVRDTDALLAACAGMDAVIHTVAYVNQLPTRQPLMYDINVLGVQHTIDACRANHVPRLIYTGSIDAVFDGTPIRDGDERLPYPAEHLDYYSETKMLGEQAVIAANSEQLVTCSLRMAGLYGEHDKHRFPNVIPMVDRSGRFTRIGDGRARFNHVYIDNAAYAFALAVERLHPGSALAGQCYFITDHAPSNFFAFFERYLSALNLTYQTTTLPAGAAHILAQGSELTYKLSGGKGKPPVLSRYTVAATSRDFWFNHDKAARDFGYAPIISAEAAFERTLAWARETLISGR